MSETGGTLRTIFIGDSITQEWQNHQPAMFDAFNINAGKGGETTIHILERFERDVVARRADIVHILAGINDIAGNSGQVTTQSIATRLLAMIQMAAANKIKVILGSILPCGSIPWNPGFDPRAGVADLNRLILEICRDDPGITLIDYFPAFATEDGFPRQSYSHDGVHLTTAGYGVLTRLAAEGLQLAKIACRSGDA